jgi:type II secretory pathway pseudopilin PulG
MPIHTRRWERGYAMAALLVAMSVMAILLSTALPVFQTQARREREAELVFRGQQYARAIGLFQRKYPNALPPDLDVLVKERFLRKKYKDPITGGDFQLLGPGSPELAAALSAPPVNAQPGAGRRGGLAQPAGRGATQPAGRGSSQSSQSTARDTQMALSQLARQTAAGQAPGGILAVASKSTQSSMRLYNGKDKYNEWLFMALQASTAAGGPRGSGAQTPGVRGGAAPGARGAPAPAGRGPGGAGPGGGRRFGGTGGEGRR